ncbi:zinc ABC transporter substrate-binding protein [bacterium]|nr:zinc ABC transporter substrate-binding protein [bacterium]
MRSVNIILWLCLAAALPATGADDRPRVTVSIAPQAWLIEWLAGDAVDLAVALAPGESPATYDPTPRRLAELFDTQLYLGVGVPMERVLLPRLREGKRNTRVVDLALDVTRLAIHAHAHDHDHDDAEMHETGFDPHVWLSPRRMKIMAGAAAAALAEQTPALAGVLETNLQRLNAELDSLDASVAAALAPAAGRTMFVFHPAFGYLAHDYGFTQRAVEKDGLPPSPRHLATVLSEIRAQGAAAVFVQPQSASAQLRAVAEAEGLTVVVLDPLARDYARNLREMAAAIGAALAPAAGEVAP